MNKSLVSIIIPTYNRAHLIGETLDSVLAQTHENWECIIVDDGSIDNTEDVVEKYTENDSRFIYFKRPADRPKGGNACRNYGFEQSKGDFIKWFDSDDLMKNNFISIQFGTLNENPNLEFCAAFCEVFSKSEIQNEINYNPRITQKSENIFIDFLHDRIFFLTSSTLWRRDFLEGKKLFDEELFRGQEADFNFRRLVEGADFVYNKEKLFLLRRGHDSIESSSAKNISSFESRFKYYNLIFHSVDKNVPEYCIKIQTKQYIISKQSSLFGNLYKSNSKSMYYNQLLENVSKSNIPIFRRIILRVGIELSHRFGKGYRLLKLWNYSEQSESRYKCE